MNTNYGVEHEKEKAGLEALMLLKVLFWMCFDVPKLLLFFES
jgi:hypothetical protein